MVPVDQNNQDYSSKINVVSTHFSNWQYLGAVRSYLPPRCKICQIFTY